MVEVTRNRTSGDELKAHSIPSSVLFQIPMLPRTASSSYCRMVREEVMPYQEVYLIPLVLGEDSSPNDMGWPKYIDEYSVLNENVIHRLRTFSLYVVLC